MSTIVDEIRSGRKHIGIFGIGYIGFSTACAYASRGVKVVATDVDVERVKLFNEGRSTVPNMDFWVGYDTKYLVDSGVMGATTDWEQLISPEVPVIFISVPTERDAMPFDDYILDVFTKLATFKDVKMESKPIFIIESTIARPVIDKVEAILNADGQGWYVLGICNRRDWFGDAAHNLQTIPRILGVDDGECRDVVKAIIEVVSPDVRLAPSVRDATLVKALENALRATEISVINQMATAFKQTDVIRIAELAASKWNVGLFRPGYLAGYCLPVSFKYLMLSGGNVNKLSIFSEVMNTNDNMPSEIVMAFYNRGVKRVAILGMSYKADIPVSTLSASIPIADGFRHCGIECAIHDPYFGANYISEKAACGTFSFPDDLGKFDAILILADHRAYKSVPLEVLCEKTKNVRFILDLTDLWLGKGLGKEYHRLGDAGWFGENFRAPPGKV